jgi:hypothetical protein
VLRPNSDQAANWHCAAKRVKPRWLLAACRIARGQQKQSRALSGALEEAVQVVEQTMGRAPQRLVVDGAYTNAANMGAVLPPLSMGKRLAEQRVLGAARCAPT